MRLEHVSWHGRQRLLPVACARVMSDWPEPTAHGRRRGAVTSAFPRTTRGRTWSMAMQAQCRRRRRRNLYARLPGGLSGPLRFFSRHTIWAMPHSRAIAEIAPPTRIWVSASCGRFGRLRNSCGTLCLASGYSAKRPANRIPVLHQLVGLSAGYAGNAYDHELCIKGLRSPGAARGQLTHN